MIRVTNIRNANKDDYDAVYAIVRSLKSSTAWIQQMTELSPSPSLFGDYRRLADTGQWGRQAFDEMYVPRFIDEIRQNAVARQTLNRLWRDDREGKKICLVCFCPDERLCHRSIIAGFLQGAGCQVVTDTNGDYSKYYDALKH